MDSAGASQQVSWWSTHEFVAALVAQANVGPLPWAGTPNWCVLADSDPRKLLALAVAGTHHVLRIETAQEARAEASHAVADSADWSRMGREINRRKDFYASRPWLRRRVS